MKSRIAHYAFLLVIVITLLSGVLRFYKLDSVPIGFHRDEAFLGYNAYSLMKTGRDMSGKFFPLHLESFIYSPAGYVYFSTPFLYLFGLHVFSVRMASAFFSTLTVLVVYFLIQSLFAAYSHKRLFGIITSLLVALSPWSINLARTATENSIVVFFVSLGVYCYSQFLQKRKISLIILSFACFFVTILTYQSPRAFIPLFLPLMLLTLPRTLGKKRELGWSVGLYALFILVPLITILSSPNLSLRIRTVSLFATEDTQLKLDALIREDGVSAVPYIFTRMHHNKIVGYGLVFLQNYFSHFSYSFLFTDAGLPDRYRVPFTGLMYIVEIPFLFLGLWLLLSRFRTIGIFFLGWILVSPIGSALAFDDVPNLQRTLLILPALPICVAFGITEVISLRRKIIPAVVIVAAAILFFAQFFFYLHEYYIHMRFYRPWFRQDGYRELVKKTEQIAPAFDHIIVTNHESAPTIFFLFFTTYSPALFQKDTAASSLRDFDRVSFGKYAFSLEECPYKLEGSRKDFPVRKDTLYVNSGLCKIPTDAIVHSTIRRQDNSKVFYLLSLNPKAI